MDIFTRPSKLFTINFPWIFCYKSVTFFVLYLLLTILSSIREVNVAFIILYSTIRLILSFSDSMIYSFILKFFPRISCSLSCCRSAEETAARWRIVRTSNNWYLQQRNCGFAWHQLPSGTWRRMVMSTSQQVALAFTAVLLMFVVLPRLFGVGGGGAASENTFDPRYSRKGKFIWIAEATKHPWSAFCATIRVLFTM